MKGLLALLPNKGEGIDALREKEEMVEESDCSDGDGKILSAFVCVK